MKKISVLIGLLLIIMVSGCNSKEEPLATKDVQVASKNYEEPQKPSKSSASSSVSQNRDLEKYLMQKDKLLLIGEINDNLGIHMELQMINKESSIGIGDLYWNSSVLKNEDEIARYEGMYYNDKYIKKISVEARLYPSGYFSVIEFDDKKNITGSFGGFLSQDHIKGIWSDKEGNPKHSFYLVQTDTKPDESKIIFSRERIGSYARVDSTELYGAYLDIFMEADGKFKFDINGNWRDHIGEVDGVAFYTDSTRRRAEYHNKNDNLKITFIFKGLNVDVSANDVITGYGGANVTFTGPFKKLK